MASVVGLGTLLRSDSPGRLAASVENVAVDLDVGFSELAGRQRTADAGRPGEVVGGDDSATVHVVLASVESPAGDLAQSLDPEASPDTPPDVTPPDATPQAEPEGDRRPSPRPRPTPSPAKRLGSRSVLGPELGDLSDTTRRWSREVEDKLPPESLPEGCEYKVAGESGQAEVQCADAQAPRFLAPDDVGEGDSSGRAVADAMDLLKVLRGTRERRLGGQTSEPLGVTLNFGLTLVGYESKRIDVRLSLYNARAGVRVPGDWLVNRRALVAEPDALSQRASKEFWIPLPKEKGPFFVRLTAYDGDIRIARADSTPSRDLLRCDPASPRT